MFHSAMNAPSLPIDQPDDIMKGVNHNSMTDLGDREERGRIIEHMDEVENISTFS